MVSWLPSLEATGAVALRRRGAGMAPSEPGGFDACDARAAVKTQSAWSGVDPSQSSVPAPATAELRQGRKFGRCLVGSTGGLPPSESRLRTHQLSFPGDDE